LAGGLALLTAVPVGALADRYGPRRALVVVSLWRAAGFAAYPLVHDVNAFLLVVCLLGLVDKTAPPLEQALVGEAVAHADRVRTMAVMRAVRNVGFTVGAMMGTLALGFDTRPAYVAIVLVNALSFVALAAMAAGLPVLAEAAGARLRRPLSFGVLRDRPYLVIAVLNAVLTIHMTLLSLGVPVWIAEHSHAPRAVIAPLLIVNTVLAVLFQVRASRGADTIAGAAARLRSSGLALAACCAMLAVVPPLPAAAAVAILAVGMVALTTGELFQSAGGWGLSYELARDGEQAAYLSVFWLGFGLQQAIAPIVVAAVVVTGASGWLALGAFLAVIGLAVPRSAQRAAAPRATHAAPLHA
jgi:hypothetical protein